METKPITLSDEVLNVYRVKYVNIRMSKPAENFHETLIESNAWKEDLNRLR